MFWTGFEPVLTAWFNVVNYFLIKCYKKKQQQLICFKDETDHNGA